MNISFRPWINDLTETFLNKRKGEIKIGEKLSEVDEADFVIIGVEESIGPQANHGNQGAQNGFSSFLPKFLNMQWNRFVDGQKVAILGAIVPSNPENLSLEKKREFVSAIDEYILKILNEHLKSNQIPILIGGGHNNALPIMRWAANKSPINVINLDPHADYRPLEGRHSGNSFSYAFEEKTLKKYAVLGLHKAYNSENMLKKLANDGHKVTFFDDWLNEKSSLKRDLKSSVSFFKEKKVGVELDLDSISFMPTSAFTPSGISMEEARFYIHFTANKFSPVYLHLPEAAPKNDYEAMVTGKSIAYLVYDFIISTI